MKTHYDSMKVHVKLSCYLAKWACLIFENVQKWLLYNFICKLQSNTYPVPAAETATKLLCKLCKVHMGPIIVMNCMLILIAITSSVKIDFVKKPK